MVGTICPDGRNHLHVVLGKADGSALAGHLVSDEAVSVYTTAEIVLGDCGKHVLFDRPFDARTGYDELKVTRVAQDRRKL